MRVCLGQVRETRDDDYRYFARQLGLPGILYNTADLPDAGGRWAVQDVRALRERCAAAGLVLEALENVPFEWMADIYTGGPRRDEQLDNLRATLAAIGEAGVPIFGYHFMPTFVWRTAVTAPGRGGSWVTAFDAAAVTDANALPIPGAPLAVELTAEEVWVNYQVFLDAVLPVAERYGLTLALHPDDPPVPTLGRSARVFHEPAAFRRALEMARHSPSWALELCLGTVSEMPAGADAVREMIEEFGPTGRIAYVHFRDVRGTVPSFAECFLGEGNFDPLEIMRLLDRCGFDGPLIDDHVPAVVGDSVYGHRARAHAIGQLQCLVDVVGRERAEARR